MINLHIKFYKSSSNCLLVIIIKPTFKLCEHSSSEKPDTSHCTENYLKKVLFFKKYQTTNHYIKQTIVAFA
jgi:hypothetical protein